MKGLRRCASALVILAIWGAITVGGLLLQLNGFKGLDPAITGGLAYPILAACLFLILVIRRGRQTNLGLGPPKPWRSLVLLWFPLIVLGGLGYVATTVGIPPADTLLILVVNTCLVGFSEEVMFRGVLLSGFRAAFSLRTAVVLSTLVFGAVHSMNYLITGDITTSIAQSCAAFMTGTMLVAIRLRTGSLWPCILIHMLWDLLMFSIVSNQPPPSSPGSTGIALQFAPLLIVLPNFIYGLILMRRLR